MAAGDTPSWVPLAAVVVGGVLTTASSLLVEIFRDRARAQREVRQRRRSALVELERALVDAHAKILSSSRLVEFFKSSSLSEKSETADETALTDQPVEAGADEIARARSARQVPQARRNAGPAENGLTSHLDSAVENSRAVLARADEAVEDSRAGTNATIAMALAEGSGKIELLRAVSLAARVGTPEIQRALSEYNAAQVKWSSLATNTSELLATMESQVTVILESVARELRTVDAADERFSRKQS